jgi:UDP-glucose 4-epimerase
MTHSVLLTGGLGYVGGRVAQELIMSGNYDVTVTSRNPEIIDTPIWLPKNRCVPLDIEDDVTIAKICKNKDIIVHFAALNEIDSLRDPIKALLVNTLGTLKLVKAAQTEGVQKFIYFSTAHVYRSPLEGLISETIPTRPTHPYAITHRAAEDYVLAANADKTMTGVVIRLSNSIGAPINRNVNRWSLAGNDLCRQAVTTQEIRLKSSGLQKRDFIPLQDVARAVEHLIRLSTGSLDNGIFNLGGENSISIFDLAIRIQQRCLEILEFSPPIYRLEPNPSEKSGELTYSIEKLKSTGFLLTGSLEQEIDDTLRFCYQQYRT